MSSVTFSVFGRPIRLKRHRFCRGRVYDPSAKDKREWVEKIPEDSIPEEPFTEPLRIDIQFLFKRPKAHYRSGKYSHLLKPIYEGKQHTCTPDVDNLAKFCLDAMNTIMYKDDSQVIELNCRKSYIDEVGKPGETIITIQIIEPSST